jgi:4-hydroxy-3-methylbut-2-en-1-yl diphosphate synthase IspG/GcpE
VVVVDLAAAAQEVLSKEITLLSHQHLLTRLSLALEELVGKVETTALQTPRMVDHHHFQQLACSAVEVAAKEIKLQPMVQAVVERDMTAQMFHQLVVELEQSAKELTERQVQSLVMAVVPVVAEQEAPAEIPFSSTSVEMAAMVSLALSPGAMSTTAVAAVEVLTQTMGSTAVCA